MHRYLSAPLIAAGLFAATAAHAGPTIYTTAAAFNAATTGVTNVDFEGSTASTYILGNASHSYTQGGVTITQSTNNAFLTDPSFTPYYYNWGTGDVINTPYEGTLTITFAAPVTAFALDLGTFYGTPIPPGVTPGAATTAYGQPVQIGTSQGNFIVNTNTTQTMAFFGLTSDTAFTSITIHGLSAQTGASNVIDNVRYGSAAATGAVPEPATWAMMMLGFGFVGASLRRRSAKVTFA